MSSQAKNDAATRVAERLHASAIHLLRHVRRADTLTEVPPAQLSALSVLVFRGPTTITGLAAAEQVRPPTMTRIVQGLEASALARRRPDPADGRASVIEPTARGTRVMHTARARRLTIVREMLAAADDGEVALLGEAVAVIERLLADRQKAQSAAP